MFTGYLPVVVIYLFHIHVIQKDEVQMQNMSLDEHS